MTQFPHDSIKPFASNSSKKEQVGEMFNRIAGRYDFMNRFLSAGIDVQWRIKALKLLRKDAPQHLLDVATGTGDMAIRAVKILGPKKVTGVDISEGMLAVGRKKVAALGLSDRIELVTGDSEALPFANASFDACTAAFGVRNFENLEQGLSELNRVLQPGAPLVILEFSKPRIPLVQPLYNLYMNHICPFFAQLFTKNRRAYQYLNESSKAFPDREAFIAILKDVGFVECKFKPLSFGICCVYIARKKS